MFTSTKVGERGRYVEIVGPADRPGKIVIEQARWEVDGLYNTHQFRYVLEAEHCTNFIRRSDHIEHWVKGSLVKRFEWGHGVTDAYRLSQLWVQHHHHHYVTNILSAHVFLHDLSCCGGKFVKVREAVDASTIQTGYCSDCRWVWEITDGIHFFGRRN